MSRSDLIRTPYGTLPTHYPTAGGSARKSAREEYVRRQKGLCLFCEKSLKKMPREIMEKYRIRTGDWNLFPPGFMSNPVHLHHDHESGLTVGAVHAHCNAVMFLWFGE